MKITKLESALRGPPLLLGKERDVQVQGYVKSLWESRAMVNSTILIAVVQGIVRSCAMQMSTQMQRLLLLISM